MVRLTRSIIRNAATRLCLALGLVLFGGAAWADQPRPWELGMQNPATPITERIYAFHNELMVVICLVAGFVFALLLYVIVRFNHRSHPVPTRTLHNTVVEILWTVLPVLILVIIAIPSFKLMYYMDRVPDAAMTIKVTGHQWYWQYEYPDQGNFGFNSNLVEDKDLKPGQKRLLEVDNPLVIPVDTTIRVQVAGSDVIHSWFVPSFGVQEYAVIGRLNEAWMRVNHEGDYYGECNQICGVNHAFMPIKVHVVSKEAFQKWLVDAKKQFAAAAPAEEPSVRNAAVEGTTKVAAAADPAADAVPAVAGR
jgi:cytochrome c oxidase subunit 2